MKSVKDQEITVHEFVGLVAPYTGDNGKIIFSSPMPKYLILTYYG